MWWRELGAERRRALLAACNEPAEVALRVNAAADRSRGGAGRAARGGGRGARAATAEWPLAAPETIVIEGRTGDAVPALVEAGELTPQSRGSAAVVEVLDPQQGEHVLDLCAGPGIKTGQIAARMGDRGEVISVELDPGGPAEVAGAGAAARAAQRHRDRGRRGGDGDGEPASTASSSTRPARTSAPSPRAPTPAGASRRRRSSGWPGCSGGRCAAPPGRCGRAASSSTRPARSPAARTRTRSRRCSRAAEAGEVAAAGRRGPRRPRARPGLAARLALPAAAPGPRSHHRILHLPAESGMIERMVDE